MSALLRRSPIARTALLRTGFLAATMTAIIANGQSTDVAAIKALNEAWIHSYVTKDTATVSRIWADDFFLINPAGKRYSKQLSIANVANPAIHFLSSNVDTAEVHVAGTLGYIYARATFVSADDSGKQTKGTSDYLDVYEKRKGQWVCIAAHVIYLGDQ